MQGFRTRTNPFDLGSKYMTPCAAVCCPPCEKNVNGISQGNVPTVYFLLSVYAQYWGGLIKAMVKADPRIRVVVVHFDRLASGQISQEIAEDVPATFVRRSSIDRHGLLDRLRADAPSIIYISGWVDKNYLRCAYAYKRQSQGVAVICGIDDHWTGSLRQHLGVLYFGLFYRRIFDFMWVSGKPQYHYAQRFGYSHHEIIGNLLSAESSSFDRAGSNAVSSPARRFVFVGRFVEVKGLEVLLHAYRGLPSEVKEEWSLVLIGDGPERTAVAELQEGEQNVVVKPFMNQQELLRELSQGGVCCMPSRSEAWGVAIHEMALLGFPLVLSSACGAASEFLISGYNGFLFRSEDVSSLRAALRRMASLPAETLQLFSARSRDLGRRITNEHSAYSLVSTQYLLGLQR